MVKVCLVTYLREGEVFTTELEQIADGFHDKYGDDFKVTICCESNFESKDYSYIVEQYISCGTKYRRLISLMEKDDSQFYFSVDNDITGNIGEMLQLAEQTIKQDCDIGWGRIRAQRVSGTISNLVAVDKLLSHTIIRPILWNAGCGISVPGQVFFIRASSYRGKLINLDTFLDDVALGLYVNVNEHKKYITKAVLGFERPNTTFKGLWSQRSRWAVGYASILLGVKDNKKYSRLVRIHGLSYHASWTLVWSIIILTAIVSWKVSLIVAIIIAAIISREEPVKIGYSLLYILFFPIFHIRWGRVLIGEIKKRWKN